MIEREVRGRAEDGHGGAAGFDPAGKVPQNQRVDTRIAGDEGPRPRTRERWWLHLLLLVLTLATTTAAGALLHGQPLAPTGAVLAPLGFSLDAVRLGLAFSLPLLAILLAHELGHYLTARRYGMDVSPPYFIPAPHVVNLIGTFGAFIRLRSRMANRRALFDVGAAGPLAGFAVALPAAVVGLAWSSPAAAPAAGAGGFVVVFAGTPVWLGSSLLFEGLATGFAPRAPVIVLHPLAFAAWLGFFVTALNLVPLSQLDGGHILYALGGRWQRPVAWAFVGVLLALGVFWWGWWLWTAVILLFGRGRVAHPPMWDVVSPLPPWRRRGAWACIALFVLTFTPVPLRL